MASASCRHCCVLSLLPCMCPVSSCEGGKGDSESESKLGGKVETEDEERYSGFMTSNKLFSSFYVVEY